ncbi:hypothetical protein C0992_012017 [Termitomyces sp. T32_za158]|nr:hypothetical protein C0992_012017 [Termitomyces sp. T32_za158]
MSTSNTKPCFCTTCCGALVSQRTIYNHRDRPKIDKNPISFTQWLRDTGRSAEAGSKVSSSKQNSDNVESSEEGAGSLRKCARLISPTQSEYDPSILTDLPQETLHNLGLDIEVNKSMNVLSLELDPMFELKSQDSTPGSFVSDVSAQQPLVDSDEEEESSLDDTDSGNLDEIDASAAHLHAQTILDAHSQEVYPLEEEDEPLPEAHIESLRISQNYIYLIQNATLDQDKLDKDTLHCLRNPTEGPIDISNPDDRLSLEIFTATNANEATYNQCCNAILRRYPDSEILSFYKVKRLIADTSGVAPVMDDMCINSCHAFTGPFAELDACSICYEPRYDSEQLIKHKKKVPRQQTCSFPLGPQIQTLRQSMEGAEDMCYLDCKITEVKNLIDNLQDDSGSDMVYDDIFCGSDFIEFADYVQITNKDTMISMSLDGVQLYQSKKSDAWIGIGKVENYAPDLRYKEKKVLPLFTIPGPNKPKNVDSYIFRTLYHLSALQHENKGQGLAVWDAKSKKVIYSRILFALGTGDAVAITELDGRVGHHGAQGCHLGCGMKGRHKPNSGHYFAAHLRPNGYTVQSCNHPDINIRELEPLSIEAYKQNVRLLIGSEDQTAYERNRKATGLSKPSLLSGLVPELSFPVPQCFPLDLMHLPSINIPDLLISLWRGTLKHSNDDHWNWATLVGDVWTNHGKLVEDATQYFPSSFHRTPRNPAEKISSGFKATEWFLYIYGLGPAFFRVVLPQAYWKNYCKLVAAIRIFVQRHITGHQIAQGHSLLVQFIEEYEVLYYQRRVD